MLTHADLFAGIGGFSFALKGISRPILYCEKDLSAQKVLKNNMKKGELGTAPLVSDINDLKQIKCDIMTAGWPCTGFSLCGNLKGLDDSDSNLIRKLSTIISSSCPDVILLENVGNVTSDRQFPQLRRIVSRWGYQSAYTVIPAYTVGLPHKRSRWFCVCFKSLKTVRTMFKKWQKQISIGREPHRYGLQNSEYWRRWKLLGRSVVPQCIQFSFNLITRAILNRKGMDCNMLLVKAPEINKPDLKICITPDFRLKLWPTPRTNVSFAARFSKRSARDLQNAVKWDVRSNQQGPHIHWVEWLMGYPAGWTAIT